MIDVLAQISYLVNEELLVLLLFAVEVVKTLIHSDKLVLLLLLQGLL